MAEVPHATKRATADRPELTSYQFAAERYNTSTYPASGHGHFVYQADKIWGGPGGLNAKINLLDKE